VLLPTERSRLAAADILLLSASMTFLAGICFLLPFVASERIEAIFGSSADGSFAVKVNGEIWFRSADTSLTANNKLHSANDGAGGGTWY
jgi:hypothetical protein